MDPVIASRQGRDGRKGKKPLRVERWELCVESYVAWRRAIPTKKTFWK